MDDSLLVQRAADGDKDAFAEIYDRYAPRLQAFLWWVLQDGELATDVLADTFRVAGSRLHQLADPSRLRPWLYAITAREALGADRAARREQDAVAAADAEPAGEFVAVVRAGAQELTARDRALLDLRFRQRLQNQSLGDAIGVKAEAAEAVVQRVADRVEHLLGPTLSIRFSRKHCAELMAIVGTEPGPLDSRTSRQAEEHVDRCSLCNEWRRRITVRTLLAAAPTPPPPPGLRQRVLDDVQLAAYDGRSWSRRRSGFPPPLVSEHQDERLRRAVMMAAAAVIVVVALVAALVLASDDGDREQVASVGSSTSTTRPRATSTTVTTVRPTTTSTVTSGSPSRASGALGGGGGASGNGGVGGTGRPSNATGSSPGAAAQPEPEPEPEAEPDSDPAPGATSGTTASTPAADNEGPSLSALSVSPTVVRPSGSVCTNSDPITATVTVQASDPSGIASIDAIAALFGVQTVPMSGSGGTYSATVGPFGGGTLAGDGIDSKVVVQAIDSVGNKSVAAATITLRCTTA